MKRTILLPSALLSLGFFFGAPVGVAVASELSVLAEAPARYNEAVTDTTGTLSQEDVDKITAAVTDAEAAAKKKIYVVFVNSFDGMPAESWTKQALDENGGENVGIYAMAVSDREFGVYLGSYWETATGDAMYDAAFSALQQGDWAGSAIAAAEAAAKDGTYGLSGGSGSGSGPSAPSGADAAWLGAGAAGVAAVGGGAWVYSNRRKKKNAQESLEAGRDIAPEDTTSLAQLDIATLEKLAEEELVSTDESIKNARQELGIAVAEFGAERTRAFTRAMNHSTTTLQKAFQLKSQADELRGEQKRPILVEIVSTCGMADDALDAEAENFAKLRDLLLNAPSALDRITQLTVDLRSRIPAASSVLEELHASYSPEMLNSIEHNVEMATVSLDEAERNVTQGRELAARPAGEQGALVDFIRAAEQAATAADKLLQGVENARQNISTAQHSIAPLIKEIQDEIAEATQLRAQGQSQGTQADWESLARAMAAAREAVEKAQAQAERDPLSAWSALTGADSALDEQLDKVRETTTDHARLLAMFDQQAGAASSAIQAATDFIQTRGRVIGSTARTALADAQRLYAQALNERVSNTRSATALARQATDAARKALRAAQDDVDDYQRSQRNDNTGAIITGMVINSLLNSNRSSGWGGSSGGFGGSSGGFGGGFGGSSGGGGGFRGGRF